MTRLHRYVRSLASGYALLAANTGFTLASVPLALHYLSKAEFGLWALTSQIAGYLALLDFGMAGAQSRILIDYKDQREGTSYGSTILTGLWVGLTQGLIVLTVGGVLLWWLGPVSGMPAVLDEQFRWLMFGQCGVLAATLVTRVFGNILWAHQRTDVANVGQILLFGVNFLAMWLAFGRGAGVYSLLWGQALSGLAGLGFMLTACLKLKLLPGPRRWGRPTWDRFKELFTFGKDLFLFGLGSQMINTSQTILIAPMLGLEAAGVWAICIRPFSVVVQLVWRVLDFSATPLAEMLVRAEQERFFARFRAVTTLTGVLAVVVGTLFAVCNQPFVELWTHGRVGWSAWNDALLALWGVFVAVQRCHIGILGVRKQLHGAKYVYFTEGAVFVGLAFALTPWLGLTGVIVSSLAATVSISFVYGQWRTRKDFNLGWRESIDWLKPAAVAIGTLVPLAAALGWMVAPLAELLQLALLSGVLGVVGAVVVFRLGLDRSMRQRVLSKAPSWARNCLFGAAAQAD